MHLTKILLFRKSTRNWEYDYDDDNNNKHDDGSNNDDNYNNDNKVFMYPAFQLLFKSRGIHIGWEAKRHTYPRFLEL